MFKDGELLFSGAAWAPTGTGDNISTNVLDTGPLGLPTGSGGGSGTNAGRDLGIGSEMWLMVTVTTAVASSGGGTVAFALVTDSTATIVTKNVLVTSPAFTVAQLIAGFRWAIQFPYAATSNPTATKYQRYIAVDAVIATAVLQSGAFEAVGVKNLQTADLYVSGFTLA